MKSAIVAAMGVGLLVGTAWARQEKGKAAAAPRADAGKDSSGLKSDQEKASYGLGVMIGRDLKKSAPDLNADLVIKGLQDALGDKKVLLTDAQCRAAMEAFQKDQVTKLMAKNKKEGDDFLAANKKKEGVKTTASGLQFKVLKEGAGKTPKKTDVVRTNYRGTLIDGTEFDSSYERGKPATFEVARVIPGWVEALQLMKVGSKWQLFIPTNLAYAENPPTPAIPPNAALVFEIELLGIEDVGK